MQIKLYSNGKSETFTDDTAFLCVMAMRGIAATGTANRPSLRAELQGMPRFREIVGPMWGGDHVRYETPAVYEQCSK